MNRLTRSIAIILTILFLASPAFAKYSSVMLPKFKWFDASTGDAASGWLLNVYSAGTTTRKASYDGPTAATAATNANPVVLNSKGEADVYIDGSVKLVLTDADGVVAWTLDNFEGAAVEAVISRVVATVAALIALTGETDGELAIVQATPAGFYTWDSDNSKWRVRSGNIYATASLPSSASYTIETGTTCFDTTEEKMKWWNGTAWTVIKTVSILQIQVFN